MILTHVHGLRHFLHCDLLAEMGLDVAGHLLHQRMIHDLLCGRQIFLPFTQHIQIPKNRLKLPLSMTLRIPQFWTSSPSKISDIASFSRNPRKISS